jgi:hypothetical protein
MTSVEAAPRETTELHSEPTTYVDSVAKQATRFVNVRHRTPLAEGRTASYAAITHISMTKPACSRSDRWGNEGQGNVNAR